MQGFIITAFSLLFPFLSNVSHSPVMQPWGCFSHLSDPPCWYRLVAPLRSQPFARVNKPHVPHLQSPLSPDLAPVDQRLSCVGVPKLSTVPTCGLTTIREPLTIRCLNLLAVLLFIQPRVLLAVPAAGAGCWLILSLPSAQDPSPVDRAAPQSVLLSEALPAHR